MKRIVIIGGMGPQASLELHRQIVAGAANAGARDNDSYPEILHISIPIPDFISSDDSSRSLAALVASIGKLRLAPDDQIILACNTAHLLLPAIEKSCGVKLISIVEATTQAIEQHNAKLVGLLASPTTIKSGLYERPLKKLGCNILMPTQKEISVLEEAIRHIIANKPAEDVRGLVYVIIKRMLNDGAEKIILGCTELSVIFNNHEELVLVDPLEAVSSLVLATVQ